MKMRNKGKVYPSSSSSPAAGDSLSVLTLLPAAILTLTIALSIEDREVLAYMITRSIKSSITDNNKKKPNSGNHKPLFECDCFDCYTNYWFKWDTSVNRELIHQAIEAFEESLTSGEQLKKKGKRNNKSGHRKLAGKCIVQSETVYDVALVETKDEESIEEEEEVLQLQSPEKTTAVGMRFPAGNNKGLARKVLPDVIGLLNWRLWSLWSPNVE